MHKDKIHTDAENVK